MSVSVQPFHLAVPQTDLDELKQRLQRTRRPDLETVDDVSQGPQLNKVRALFGFRQNGYDWRRCEAMPNGFGQYRATVGSDACRAGDARLRKTQ